MKRKFLLLLLFILLFVTLVSCVSPSNDSTSVFETTSPNETTSEATTTTEVLTTTAAITTSCESEVLTQVTTVPPAPSTTAPVITVPETTQTPAVDTVPETVKPEPPTSDPYIGMSSQEFYQNYKPATSLADALYRSAHGFMSGSIEEQDQAPTVSEHQPQKNSLLIRNTSALYGDNGNSYSIVNYRGEIVNTIYKGGGYVTLEEVAAYVYAFGDIPANYIAKKSGSPSSNIWGEYLRLNHSKFSGDTSRYRYEPELPRISGCGGDYYYYEIDIGTTGTDCDPDYVAKIYNDGKRITRGAARIVYSRFDINNNKIIDPNEKFVFYTYNHYNDFQEYLNYEGGWGKMFGNITGGGMISDNYNCNPTPYIETAYADLTASKVSLTVTALFPLKRFFDYFSV